MFNNATTGDECTARKATEPTENGPSRRGFLGAFVAAAAAPPLTASIKTPAERDRAAVLSVLGQADGIGLDLNSMSQNTGLPEGRVAGILDQLEDGGRVLKVYHLLPEDVE